MAITDKNLIDLGKELVGKNVNHERFGEGIIMEFSPESEQMIFQFDEMIKPLSFPACVKDKVRFGDRDVAMHLSSFFGRRTEDYLIIEESTVTTDDSDHVARDEKPAPSNPRVSPKQPAKSIKSRRMSLAEAISFFQNSPESKSYKSIQKDAEKLRKDFVRDFPINSIHQLSQADYLFAAKEYGYQDSFCTRLMNMDTYGSLGRSLPEIFGVYVEKGKIVLNESLEKEYGSNISAAFERMKQSIVYLLECAENGDIARIRSIVDDRKQYFLYINFLLKLLAIYFPDDYIPAYGNERLEQYCRTMGIDTNVNRESIDRMFALLNRKEEESMLRTWSNSWYMWFVNFCADNNIVVSDTQIQIEGPSEDHISNTADNNTSSKTVDEKKKMDSAMKNYTGSLPDITDKIETFVDYVRYKDGDAFERIDFHDESKFLNNEGYKKRIAMAAREKLSFNDWNADEIGSGKIAARVISAIEQADNLIERAHVVPIFKDQIDPSSKDYKPDCERVLFDIYCGEDEEKAFQTASKLFGANYPLISYLFFVKDDTRFLPVSPRKLDEIFRTLGIAFQVSYNCGWENYGEFISIIRYVQNELQKADISDTEITLLDAHSFVWIMQYESFKAWINEEEQRINEVKEIDTQLDDYGLEGSTRKAVVDQRVNQSVFRLQLLKRYNSCCLCGVSNPDLLTASHIKPWADSSPKEKTDVNNGFLFCPNHDKLFDVGYISFEDDGRIIISKQLSEDDATLLNVSTEMRVKLTEKNYRYLEYHRNNILK